MIIIDSLAADKKGHEIDEYIEAKDKDAVAKQIKILINKKKDFNNFIVVVEDAQEVEFMEEKLKQVAKDHKKGLYSVTDMDDFAANKTTMEALEKDNFILLTTREGSRGADFKGKTRAYVIINLDDLTLSEF